MPAIPQCDTLRRLVRRGLLRAHYPPSGSGGIRREIEVVMMATVLAGVVACGAASPGADTAPARPAEAPALPAARAPAHEPRPATMPTSAAVSDDKLPACRGAMVPRAIRTRPPTGVAGIQFGMTASGFREVCEGAGNKVRDGSIPGVPQLVCSRPPFPLGLPVFRAVGRFCGPEVCAVDLYTFQVPHSDVPDVAALQEVFFTARERLTQAYGAPDCGEIRQPPECAAQLEECLKRRSARFQLTWLFAARNAHGMAPEASQIQLVLIAGNPGGGGWGANVWIAYTTPRGAEEEAAAQERNGGGL